MSTTNPHIASTVTFYVGDLCSRAFRGTGIDFTGGRKIVATFDAETGVLTVATEHVRKCLAHNMSDNGRRLNGLEREAFALIREINVAGD